MIKVKPDSCEESNYFYPELPCNKPAVRMIGWPDREEGPYRMCEACADHSIKNRGAVDFGPFEGKQP